MTTQFIPLEDTVRVTIDELMHMAKNVTTNYTTDQLWRVGALSMELMNIQAMVAMENAGAPQVDILVKRIHDALEAVKNMMEAQHIARNHIVAQSQHLVH